MPIAVPTPMPAAAPGERPERTGAAVLFWAGPVGVTAEFELELIVLKESIGVTELPVAAGFEPELIVLKEFVGVTESLVAAAVLSAGRP